MVGGAYGYAPNTVPLTPPPPRPPPSVGSRLKQVRARYATVLSKLLQYLPRQAYQTRFIYFFETFTRTGLPCKIYVVQST